MMSTTQQTKEVTEQSIADLAANVGFVIGVDSESHAHVHYPGSDTVEVYDVGPDYEVGDRIDSDPIRVDNLNGRPLSDWMVFVDESRDWSLTTHRAPEGF